MYLSDFYLFVRNAAEKYHLLITEVNTGRSLIHLGLFSLIAESPIDKSEGEPLPGSAFS